MIRRLALALVFTLGFAVSGLFAVSQPAPTLVLQGMLTRADYQTYRLLPFRVPPGTRRVTVELRYTGHKQHTVIDLACFDESRFRGSSGGKSQFTISATDATPSYLPGPIHPGIWKVMLAVPNIRRGVTSHYQVKIWLARSEHADAGLPLVAPVLRDAAGWYKGDLHMHTANSDGSCRSLSGTPVPCPVFVTAQAAARRGLDFIAITDHNTSSTYNAERELQPWFDTVLFLHGREITTFFGHANVFGTERFIDYRVGYQGRTINDVIADTHRNGALFSINHPADPSGEACMGCGWTAPHTGFRHVDAIEVINGTQAEGPRSGIPFWQAQLNQGHRITAIGGSDTHRPDQPPPQQGTPTTVVYARQLSEAAILDGIRAGHVYLKVAGPQGPDLFLTAEADGHAYQMGDGIHLRRGDELTLQIRAEAAAGDRLELVQDAEGQARLDQPQLHSAHAVRTLHLTADGQRHWYRVNLRDASGKLVALTNPVYVNFTDGGR